MAFIASSQSPGPPLFHPPDQSASHTTALEMENFVPSPEFRAVTEDSKGPDALSHVLIGQMGFEF